MTDFLQQMASSSRARAELAAATRFHSSDFDRNVIPLTLDGFDIIAEIKDRSPAEGALAENSDESASALRRSRAAAYEAGGAAAISVLTEPSRFDGALEHLEEVVDAVPETPVMRKDFLVHPVQVMEARKAGASGVLLITAMLSDSSLREMLNRAYEFGMFVLLEAFDEQDLQRSSALLEQPADRDRADAQQLLIGVNTRNLRTLEVDPERLKKLAPALPAAQCVAESGLRIASDAARVRQWGYRLALVGTALMRHADPAMLVQSMREAGAAA